MSKAGLLDKLTDKEYREAFISEEIDVGLPMQLRAMRESRGWTQGEVARTMETKQPRFSLMEKPGYGNFSLNTLKKIASLFDVGLIVSFVPFSEMIDFTEAISAKRLAIPRFVDEYARLARRYSRGRHEQLNTGQSVFDFASTGALGGAYVAHTTTPEVSESGATFTHDEVISIPAPLMFNQTAGSTHAAA